MMFTFSSTFKAANLAKEMTPDIDVRVISSGSNTMALGFQVLAAARAARSGKDIDEVLAILENLKLTSGVVFATPHIEYLRRGGRINHIQHFGADHGDQEQPDPAGGADQTPGNDHPAFTGIGCSPAEEGGTCPHGCRPRRC
ncbi:MAG: DegV family protein [Anaerolineales bacterium]